MRNRLAVSLILLGLAACEGTVSWQLEPSSFDAGRGDGGVVVRDAGPAELAPVFSGWPSGAAMKGAASLDLVLYAITDSAFLSLATDAPAWAPVTVPVMAGEKPTSLSRFDSALYLTVSSGSGGGVLTKTPGSEWSRVSGLPDQPCWATAKRGDALFVATTGGVYVKAGASAWALRSAAGEPLFSQGVTFLIAAPTQQRMFAVGATGELSHSDDSGATWSKGLVQGAVSALAASGTTVLVQTSVDGARRSENYGSTFKAMPLDAQAMGFAIDAESWAATSRGLKVSVDLGVNWANDVNALPGGLALRAVFISGSAFVVDSASGPFVLR